MRRGLIAALAAMALGSIAFFAAMALGSDGQSPARTGAPTLRIVRTAPLTVKGERFRSRERVRVTAAAKVKRTRANGNGVFVVVIPGADRCSTTRVIARGSAGSYAVAKVLPSPECMPARSG